MWQAGIAKVRANQIAPDPVLAAGKVDRRRGLTLIARPSAEVRKRVNKLLRDLRRREPNQYYYAASDIHLTVLSLFTATTIPGPFFAKMEQYIAAVDAALAAVPPIHIEFAGITASSAAILIQGFPENETLNNLRDKLRQELHRRGLADSLDSRYRLETAHLTVVRFKSPLRDSEKLAATLENFRKKPFGSTTIRQLHMVKNDWYMSHRTLQTVKGYRLLMPTRSPHTSAIPLVE
jgi:2'-5' RNA ligase